MLPNSHLRGTSDTHGRAMDGSKTLLLRDCNAFWLGGNIGCCCTFGHESLEPSLPWTCHYRYVVCHVCIPHTADHRARPFTLCRVLCCDLSWPRAGRCPHARTVVHLGFALKVTTGMHSTRYSQQPRSCLLTSTRMLHSWWQPRSSPPRP